MKAKVKKIGTYKYKKHQKKKFGAHSKKKANFQQDKFEMKQMKKKMAKEEEKKNKTMKKKSDTKKNNSEEVKQSGKTLKNYKKSLKKKAKKEKQKLKAIEKKEDEILNKKDHIEFGEVVHGPPELTCCPRGLNANENDQRSGLLLLEKFQTSLNKVNSGSSSNSQVFGKRQKLSKSRLKELEDERNRVIKAYKSMKAKRKPEISDLNEISSSSYCNFLTVDDI